MLKDIPYLKLYYSFIPILPTILLGSLVFPKTRSIFFPAMGTFP